MGDERLDARYGVVLDQLWSNPTASIPAACGGWAETQAAYRFFSNEKVSETDVLMPHKERTIERIREQKVALVVQDTTELDYTKKREKIQGLGVLNMEERYGCYLHPTVVFTPEGLCLGVTSAQFVTRESGSLGKKTEKEREKEPIEDKESYRWLEGYREACELAELAPETEVVMVADREGDIYEIFEEAGQIEKGKAHWLIRSTHSRAVDGKEFEDSRDYLHEVVSRTEPLGEVEFDMPARAGRPARRVRQTIYASTETLQPPKRKGRRLGAQKVTIILAREENPPKGREPVEWFLITSAGVRTLNRAIEIINWYVARWGIEVFFRVLKTGCRVEELQLEQREHLLPCLAVYMIIAWRILFLTHLGRQCPDISCEVVFDKVEWKAAYIVAMRSKPPKRPPTLNEMIKIIAQFGGYLNRNNDPPPGAQAMWIGLQRTRDFALGQMALQQAGATLL